MYTRLNRAQPYALGLFRIVVGLLFACHGAASLFGVLGGAMGGGSIPAGTWPGWYAALIQLVGGTLIVLGLGTRIAAFVASGSMAYAYFKVHQPEALFPHRTAASRRRSSAGCSCCWSSPAPAPWTCCSRGGVTWSPARTAPASRHRR